MAEQRISWEYMSKQYKVGDTYDFNGQLVLILEVLNTKKEIEEVIKCDVFVLDRQMFRVWEYNIIYPAYKILRGDRKSISYTLNLACGPHSYHTYME